MRPSWDTFIVSGQFFFPGSSSQDFNHNFFLFYLYRVHRVIQAINHSLDWQFSINVSVVEIYNDMLQDLLGEDPSAKLDIRQGRESLFVPGLPEIQVNHLDELSEVGVTVYY